MSRSIRWLVAAFAVLQFMPGLESSSHSTADVEQTTGFEETGAPATAKKFQYDFWTWNPIDFDKMKKDLDDDFIVKPNVRNFDDITVDIETERTRDNNIGSVIGTIFGCLFLLFLLIGCVRLCCCKQTTVTHGIIIQGSAVRAPEVEPTQPVLQHYPPPPPAYDNIQQHHQQFPPQYQPPINQHPQYTGVANPGFQYSPPMQYPHQQVPSPSSPYGAPPVVKY